MQMSPIPCFGSSVFGAMHCSLSVPPSIMQRSDVNLIPRERLVGGGGSGEANITSVQTENKRFRISYRCRKQFNMGFP